MSLFVGQNQTNVQPEPHRPIVGPASLPAINLMTGTEAGPTERPQDPPPSRRGQGGWVFWLCLCAALGMVQVMFAGYQLGAGNQGIQIAFLKHLADPSLYAQDLMVRETLGSYPSYFFLILAGLLRFTDVETLYFWAHLLTAAGVLAGVYALGRSASGSHAVGLVMVALLLMGHHRALGNDDLYSPGFSHTAAALPLAMLALLLFYRAHAAPADPTELAADTAPPAAPLWPAFAVAGLLFNLHALTAAYLLAMLSFATLWDVRSRRQTARAAGAIALATLLAAPTLLAMLMNRQSFSGEWIALMHIRSPHHLLPGTWWSAGSTEVVRFVLLGGLAAVAMSLSPRGGMMRTSLLLLSAAAVLFGIGYIFTQIYPTPLLMRLQPFRASRLVLVIFLLHIAMGIVAGWRTGGFRLPSVNLRFWRRPTVQSKIENRKSKIQILSPERLLAAITLAVLAIPVLLVYLPAVLLLAVMVALIGGRLSWHQALAGGGAMLVGLVAWRTIQFPLPGLDFLLPARWELLPAIGAVFWLALLAAVALAALGHRATVRRLSYPLAAAVLAIAFVSADRLVRPAFASAVQQDDWIAIQRWAQRNTPADAVFLTPVQPGGFRIHAERSVVGEWRDGTQMFFSSGFGPLWWERMNALQPGAVYDSTGRRLLARGQPLESLDEIALVELAERFGATHLVLPAGSVRSLDLLHENGRYAVYLPMLPPEPAPPDDARSAEIWAEQLRFMREVVEPNIEQHRKADAVVRLTDAAGRPVQDMPYELRLINHHFNFGASLPFFEEPAGRATNRDFMPPPVEQAELDRFLEIFNFSMIPFSGKWMYIEAEEGVRTYDDLDRYIEWCVANNIRVEFHFLSGYSPAWMRNASPEKRQEAFLRHAIDLVERYGDRVDSWQVVNEKHLLAQAVPVFQAIREIAPDAVLGISDCARFHAERRSLRERDLLRGIDEVRHLQSEGVQLDYFAFHAHRPFGVWPDVREAYYAMDQFAEAGVRLHISEFMMPLHPRYPMTGPVRQGVWTEQLQAEFYETFLAVSFSHPAVDAINFWGIGPHTWQPGSGLLDENYQPKEAFHAVRRLIREQWHTERSGRTPIDGTLRFRGFYGEYELILQTPDGTRRQTFKILPGQDNQIRVRLGGDDGSDVVPARHAASP